MRLLCQRDGLRYHVHSTDEDDAAYAHGRTERFKLL
jgi:hypothetical protein